MMTGRLFLETSWWALLLTAVLSYLLGSISFAILITRRYAHRDIRDFGSGNAGATNVLRSQGVWPAVWTTLGDLAKSIASVLIGYWLVHISLVMSGYNHEMIKYEMVGKYLAGVCCILGHLYPLYFGFRGGKGVMTSLGMMLILDWRAALCCLLAFGITVAISRMVSLGSVIAGLLLPFFTLFFAYVVDGQRSVTVLWVCGAMTALIALILVVKHIPNLRRIRQGTESKLSFGKRT